MRIFDTNVQKLKYDVLREVARHAYEDTLQDAYLDIPKTIAPGPEPTMRCCIYKERAIAAERVKLAMGGEKGDRNSSWFVLNPVIIIQMSGRMMMIANAIKNA